MNNFLLHIILLSHQENKFRAWRKFNKTAVFMVVHSLNYFWSSFLIVRATCRRSMKKNSASWLILLFSWSLYSTDYNWDAAVYFVGVEDSSVCGATTTCPQRSAQEGYPEYYEASLGMTSSTCGPKSSMGDFTWEDFYEQNGLNPLTFHSMADPECSDWHNFSDACTTSISDLSSTNIAVDSALDFGLGAGSEVIYAEQVLTLKRESTIKNSTTYQPRNADPDERDTKISPSFREGIIPSQTKIIMNKNTWTDVSFNVAE